MLRTSTCLTALSVFLAATLVATPGNSAPSPNHGGACRDTAKFLRKASIYEARDDFWVSIANCRNLTDSEDAGECFEEAIEEWWEALHLAYDQHEARLDLCQRLGGVAYDPEIEPEDFTCEVTNPFFPLNVGQTKVFRKETDEGEVEIVEETVLPDKREIAGVECACVLVLEYIDGELIEETRDYYAQDSDGNVWYFGESVLNFDEETGIIDTEGQWFADIDGAKPGIIMLADPIDETYRQEVLWNEAEDVASVAALGQSVCVPAGDFDGCVETLDWTPLEPGVFEAKFYAPDIGLVLEVDLESGERVELISY